MAENKKYYYLKLKEDFFDSEDMKIIESMENGYLYSNILLKMYLKSLKNNGELVFKEFIPYDTKMLATITGHNIDIVEKALHIFKRLGFIDVLDNGTIFMLDVQNYIGQISTEGKRKAEYRARIKQKKQELLEGGTEVGHCPDIISISNSNSNSNSNIISNSNNEEDIVNKKESKNKYGTFNNVLLTQTEYEKLQQEFTDHEEAIDYLSEYIELKGYKAKSHYLALRKWVFTALKEQKVKEAELQKREERLQQGTTTKKRDNSMDLIKEAYIRECQKEEQQQEAKGDKLPWEM